MAVYAALIVGTIAAIYGAQYNLANYIAAVRDLKPGVTMMIMHCTAPTEVFEKISGSGETRLGDLEAMLDPRFQAVLEEEGIVLTTWRELMVRRGRVQ